MKKRLITEFLNFRQYLWVDEKGKKSRLSAPQYIDYIMTYVQKTINDEGTFPTKHGKLQFFKYFFFREISITKF